MFVDHHLVNLTERPAIATLLGELAVLTPLDTEP